MLNEDGRLLVIEEFWEDRELPKFKQEDEDRADKYENMSEDDFMSRQPIRIARNGRVSVINRTIGIEAHKKLPWYKSIFNRKPASPPTPEPTMSVQEFFSSVKNTMKELAIIEERAAGYEQALLDAQNTGQKALYEKLVAGLNAFKMETQLIAIGLTKYVEDESIIEFYKKSAKGLRLDWIRNFARPIPANVIEIKVRADELGIFDNYVILHYDPDAKSFAETQAEKAARLAAKQDPILFGMMKDRSRFYFVGDWIDEHCDLTLDQFADMMGTNAVKHLALKDPYREKS